MDKFYLKIIWLLFSLFSLANSLSLEEREVIFHEHSCGANECEVIEVQLPRRRKRSADSKISFPLKAFGRERTLSLQLSSGVIVGENTPVYYAQSETEIQITTYQIVKSLVRSQFYEDKVNLAAFTIDTDSEVPKIKYGIVHSENLTITPLNPSKNSSNSSPRQYYLAKSFLSNLFNDVLGWSGLFGGWSSFHKRTTPVPAQVYPEILAVIDHNLVKLYGNSIFQHTIDLWNQIDAVYRPLQNPSIKLSIAGFLIPQNSGVFPSLYGSSGTNYHQVLEEMTSWLLKARHSIPFSSYDVHMVMTDRRHWDRMTLGLTLMYSACTGVLENKPRGGIFLDDRNDPKSFVTGAHELGHALGVNHDDTNSWGLMAPARAGKEWSLRSKSDMQTSMHDADFSCLDNYPNTGSNPINNPGPTFSNSPTNFDTDLKPADIDSGYDFEKIDFNNFVPPLSGGSNWNDDIPANSYPENSYNDDNYDLSGSFSYYDTRPDQGEYDYSYW